MIYSLLLPNFQPAINSLWEFPFQCTAALILYKPSGKNPINNFWKFQVDYNWIIILTQVIASPEELGRPMNFDLFLLSQAV